MKNPSIPTLLDQPREQLDNGDQADSPHRATIEGTLDSSPESSLRKTIRLSEIYES